MPQTSPMSWMTISMLPMMFLLILIKNNEKSSNWKKKNKIQMNMKKWPW